MITRTTLLVLLILFCTPLKSAENEQNHPSPIRISLLTCAPGEEIYSLFGHTAIRYEDESKGIDKVFNYGLFSFNTPNFILRFALGETDYLLGMEDYQRFASEYDYFDRSVWQQTLNLLPHEKEKLIDLLIENSLPENRVYRYNFFYDNCSTRARDKIEESIRGKVEFKPLTANGESKSFRDIVHQYTKEHPWAQFGIDLCVGSDADHPITERQMMFVPFYLMNAFSEALIIKGEEENRKLVSSTEKIIDCEADQEIKKNTAIWNILTPMRCALILFITTAGVTIFGIRKKRGFWGLDLILFGAAGTTGCILAFLALLSQHPAVSSNYLLFVFHPGQLICLPFVIQAVRKRRKSWYHVFNFIVLTLFITLFPLIPQRIDLAVVPLALSLLIRSASNLILTYKRNE